MRVHDVDFGSLEVFFSPYFYLLSHNPDGWNRFWIILSGSVWVSVLQISLYSNHRCPMPTAGLTSLWTSLA